MVEFVLGLGIVIGWFGVVLWGAAGLVVAAKQTKDWERVWVAVISAMAVAGPLLFVMPDHVFLGGHTIGLGAVLAIVSGGLILLTRPQVQRLLARGTFLI